MRVQEVRVLALELERERAAHRAAVSNLKSDLIWKHSRSVNLVHRNLLHSTIIISNMKANVW